jgi:hypothetical protein
VHVERGRRNALSGADPLRRLSASAPAALVVGADSSFYGDDIVRLYYSAKLVSNQILKPFDDIVDHRWYARNTLIDPPRKIISNARCD